jgi:hypothetical protein
MRSLHRGVSLAAVVGFVVASACTSKSNGNNPDAGLRFGDDASFDAPVDTGEPGEAGPVEASSGDGSVGPGDASADATTYPPSAGSSGAFGVVTVNGKQKLYMPSGTLSGAGNATIAAVDVGLTGSGVTGAAALVHSIDLGTPNVATCTGGDSTTVVAASTDTNDVWFIDPSTDTVTKHINLDSTYGQSAFSSGGGYVTGIAVDAATHTALLAVWNGFALVDLSTQTITKFIQAPPSENFGYDSVHRLVFAPFYDCSSSVANGMAPSSCSTPMAPEGGVMGAGLSVIDLSDGSVYTYEDPAAMDPTNPLGAEPDSAGVDPVSQIVVVPAENDGYENFLDFSKAVFDKATLTVTAPHVLLNGFEDEGVAIEPTSHIAFFEGETGPDVAALSAVQAMAGSQSYVDGTMPTLPGGGNFANLGDPHGIAVSTSIINGKPVGFVVDSGLQWVARVDLTALQSSEAGDSGVTVGPAAMNAAVTYLDSTTVEP